MNHGACKFHSGRVLPGRLDLYYHLHDEDSRQAMAALAAPPSDTGDSLGANEGILRAADESKFEVLAQTPEFHELINTLDDELKESERAGFEPAVESLQPYDGLANRCLQPLGHLSKAF